ncbi:hypothetical protein PIB30_004062 [Stylosanthes scabra]|uniref:Retrotransposon Copia-like N-terminal domain-containing protein n=1 Tax=Stylosanthes scabra TaxID=79078 RepID=A0ABU6Y1S0_9FABA|nr:hypothetical protein [Stylosanthes scabra]
MAYILTNSTNGFKSSLIPLDDKLKEKNYSTWKYQAWLTVQTLSLEHHLDLSKTPSKITAPFVADSAVSNTTPPSSDGIPATPPPTAAVATESATYREWRQNDLTLQTWLAAFISKPYQIKILHYDYLVKLRTIAESLTALDHPISDDDYIHAIIDGFNEEYHGFLHLSWQDLALSPCLKLNLSYKHMMKC